MPEAEKTEVSETSMFQRIFNELEAVKADNADLRMRLDRAQTGGAVEPYPGFVAHVAHIMQKYYYHERPESTGDADVEASKHAPTAQFDAVTGERLSPRNPVAEPVVYG